MVPAILVVVLLASVASPAPGRAQGMQARGAYSMGEGNPRAVTYFRTAETAVANMVIGGLITGAGAWLRGEDFFSGLGWGALGGALSFSGKYLAGRQPLGGGLVGRQVAEFGHSIALNGSRGRGPLAELWLAWGPVRVRVRGGDHAQAPAVRVNLASLAAAGEYAFRSDTRFSLEESLASGALVFEATARPAGHREGREVHGIARGSAVLISGTGTFDRTSTLGHELVHMIQSDLVIRLVTSPVERYLRHQVGLTAPLLSAMEVSDGLQLFNYDPFLRWFETEADRLQR